MPEKEPHVDVAADGEVFAMTPLVYKIRPSALHVVVPRSTPITRDDHGKHSDTRGRSRCRSLISPPRPLSSPRLLH